MPACPHCGHPVTVSLSALPASVPVPEPEPTPGPTPQNLHETLVRYLDVVHSTDLRTAAVHAFGAEPSTAQLERTRRQLDRMARTGQLTRSTDTVAGWNGGRLTTWTRLD